MSARAMPTRSQGRPTKRIPSSNSVRSARQGTGEISKPSRLQTSKPRPQNGEPVFDPETFNLGHSVTNQGSPRQWPRVNFC